MGNKTHVIIVHGIVMLIIFPNILIKAIKAGNLEIVVGWLVTLQPESIMHELNYHIFNAPDRLKVVGIVNARHTLYTALHLAAVYNQPVIAKLLLDKGAGIIYSTLLKRMVCFNPSRVTSVA